MIFLDPILSRQGCWSMGVYSGECNLTVFNSMEHGGLFFKLINLRLGPQFVCLRGSLLNYMEIYLNVVKKLQSFPKHGTSNLLVGPSGVPLVRFGPERPTAADEAALFSYHCDENETLREDWEGPNFDSTSVSQSLESVPVKRGRGRPKAKAKASPISCKKKKSLASVIREATYAMDGVEKTPIKALKSGGGGVFEEAWVSEGVLTRARRALVVGKRAGIAYRVSDEAVFQGLAVQIASQFGS